MMNRRLSLIVCALVAAVGGASAGDWPQWRGPDHSDVSQEIGLLKTWPADGPKRVWLNENVGLGYSGFSIVDGKLFTMGAINEDDKDNEYLICLDANTGEQKWKTKVGPTLGNGWGNGPRGTPTVDGAYVYAMGGTGDVICAQTEDGKQLWTASMVDLGGKAPQWGYCESVLVDGPRVVCTPGGGQGAIVALNKDDGKVLWRSTDLTAGAQYASIIPAKINGQAQYVQLFTDILAAVSPEDGKVLWTADWPGKTAVIPTPIVKDNYIFVTSGYGVGCSLIEIDKDNKSHEVYFNKNMKNHHGGVLLLGDFVYGHSDGVGWMCLNFKTGEVKWNERGALGKGCVTCADGMLYCIDEGNGEVALVEASPNGWNEHSRFKMAPQTSRRNPRGRIWTHPVVSNGKLYLRDQDLLYCYDVKAE
jgi:outer membrane protein assembly factor BamB